MELSVFSWVHNRDNDNIKLGITSMGWNIQSVQHCKVLRMRHAPKINETELLCNILMLQKYFDLKGM